MNEWRKKTHTHTDTPQENIRVHVKSVHEMKRKWDCSLFVAYANNNNGLIIKLIFQCSVHIEQDFSSSSWFFFIASSHAVCVCVYLDEIHLLNTAKRFARIQAEWMFNSYRHDARDNQSANTLTLRHKHKHSLYVLTNNNFHKLRISIRAYVSWKIWEKGWFFSFDIVAMPFLSNANRKRWHSFLSLVVLCESFISCMQLN